MGARRHLLFFACSAIVLVLVFILDIRYGAVRIPLQSILNWVFGDQLPAGQQFILDDFRLPKAITALLAGAAIAVSGLIMQTFFRNPLAGPFVLGVSSGASLGVALLVMAGSFVSSLLVLGQWGIVIASFAGSVLVMLLIVLAAARVRDSVSLLLIGLMFGSFTAAAVSVLQYFSVPELVQTYLFWTFGSLSGVGWTQLWVLAPLLLLGLLLAMFTQKSLNLLLLGEGYASSMGLNLRKTRFLLIVTTCLLAGSVTAFCGPIAFLGMAVPHLSRNLLKTSDHKMLLPATALLGSVLLLFCDLLTQLPGRNLTLPINAITSIIGAPVVIMIIIRAGKRR